MPEVTMRALKPKDRFLVIASDGVWQGVYVCMFIYEHTNSLSRALSLYEHLHISRMRRIVRMYESMSNAKMFVIVKH
jgi:hypothetical protein